MGRAWCWCGYRLCKRRVVPVCACACVGGGGGGNTSGVWIGVEKPEWPPARLAAWLCKNLSAGSTPTPTVAHLPAARVLQAEVLPAAPQALAALGEHGSAERCSRRDGLAGRRQLVTGVRMLCQTEMTAAVLPMNLWACFGLRRDYLGSEPAFCLRELAAGGQEILLARFTQPAKGAPAGAEQGSSFTPGQNVNGHAQNSSGGTAITNGSCKGGLRVAASSTSGGGGSGGRLF